MVREKNKLLSMLHTTAVYTILFVEKKKRYLFLCVFLCFLFFLFVRILSKYVLKRDRSCGVLWVVVVVVVGCCRWCCHILA